METRLLETRFVTRSWTEVLTCACEIENPNFSGKFHSGVKDSLQPEGVSCAEEVKHTHTHTHTDNMPANTDHHTAEFLKTMSELYGGIQCRLTARTAGNAKVKYLLRIW